MKKFPKINKPISLTTKNIARIRTSLVRRNANTVRSQNRMSGGLNETQIKEFQGFLTEYAETVEKLKYILLNKLCEHTIATVDTEKYKEELGKLQQINKAFTDNPKLYKYNIPAIEHTDPDINFLINAVKLVSSFDSSVSKLNIPGLDTKELEDVNSRYTFNTLYIPAELLQNDNKEDFEKEYREIQITRGIIPVLTPPSPPQLPSPPPLPAKETPEEARERLLRDSLILSRKIVVSQEELHMQQDQSNKEHQNILQRKKNNLEERIETYKLINNELNTIDENSCLIGKHGNYKIGEIVELYKVISGGNFGMVYRTKVYVKNSSKYYEIASKIMESIEENKNEIKINKWITQNLILTKHSKHFVLTYKSTECIDQRSILGPREKLVNYNELCEGSLFHLILKINKEKSLNFNLINNIYIQAIICIATYQNWVGYIHNDIKTENFLYQINSDNMEGYYHYIYNDTTFYIKNSKYNIMISDFGISTPIINNNFYVDYDKFQSGINYDVKLEKDYIFTKLGELISASINQNEKNLFKNFIEGVLKLDQDICVREKPEIILNINNPYIINMIDKNKKFKISGGRKPTKYKSTGNAVYIMYKKKKYKRTIYAKDKRKTKYCKINNEYILLSKLKVLE